MSKKLRETRKYHNDTIAVYTKNELIEQIWKQIRHMGVRNKIFKTLNIVVNRLRNTINLFIDELVKSIIFCQGICSF